MKILMFSDLHLAEGTKDLATKLLTEILNRDDYDGVFHLGDLFQQKDRIPNYLNKIIIDFVSELQAKGKFFYTLYGNHDGYIKECPNAIYLNKFGDGVKLITEPEIVGDYLMLPYSENTEELIKAINNNRTRYCCLHNDIIGLSLPNGSKLEEGLDLDFLVSNFEKVFCGHIHLPQQIGDIICLGNPFARNFTEASKHNKKVKRGYYIVEGDEVTFYHFEAPYYVKLVVTDKKVVDVFNDTYVGESVHLWIDYKDDEISVEISDKVKVLSKIVTKDVSSSEAEESAPVLSLNEINTYIEKIMKKVPKKKRDLYLTTGRKILERFGIGSKL